MGNDRTTHQTALPTRDPATEAVRGMLAEHANPSHCSRSSLADGLAPIDRLLADERRQIFEYQLHVAAIEEALPPDHVAGGILEHMHQTLGALEREAAAVMTATRNLRQAKRQLDAYLLRAASELPGKD